MFISYCMLFQVEPRGAVLKDLLDLIDLTKKHQQKDVDELIRLCSGKPIIKAWKYVDITYNKYNFCIYNTVTVVFFVSVGIGSHMCIFILISVINTELIVFPDR